MSLSYSGYLLFFVKKLTVDTEKYTKYLPSFLGGDRLQFNGCSTAKSMTASVGVHRKKTRGKQAFSYIFPF